jgi:hypothetical protein
LNFRVGQFSQMKRPTVSPEKADGQSYNCESFRCTDAHEIRWREDGLMGGLCHRAPGFGVCRNPPVRGDEIWAQRQSAPYTHFSEQLKRLAAEHRVRFENSRSAVGARSL